MYLEIKIYPAELVLKDEYECFQYSFIANLSWVYFALKMIWIIVIFIIYFLLIIFIIYMDYYVFTPSSNLLLQILRFRVFYI